MLFGSRPKMFNLIKLTAKFEIIHYYLMFFLKEILNRLFNLVFLGLKTEKPITVEYNNLKIIVIIKFITQ